MSRRNSRADIVRVSQVLAGIEYPAAKWQLIMFAEEYGADAATRAQLWSLPTGTYRALAGVLGVLGLTDAPALPFPAPHRSPAIAADGSPAH